MVFYCCVTNNPKFSGKKKQPTNLSCSQILRVSNLDKAQWEWVVSVLWYLGFSWGDLKLSSVGTPEQSIHPRSLHMAWASSQHGVLWALGLLP